MRYEVRGIGKSEVLFGFKTNTLDGLEGTIESFKGEIAFVVINVEEG